MIKTGSEIRICAVLTGFLLLSACGETAAPESEVTETVLGDIDVLEGSTSDEMITVDEFDNAENTAPAPAATDAPAADDAQQDAPATDAQSSEGDTVIRPRTGPNTGPNTGQGTRPRATPRTGPAAPTGPDNADTGV
jgi:hypothetical protein